MRSLETLVFARMLRLEANLDHPIILSAEGWVMDGMHGICKALLLGQESILAIRFSPTPEPNETH